MSRWNLTGWLLLVLTILRPCDAWAIRPFVTDDARVVGERLAQAEAWLFADQLGLQQNVLFAVGPTEWLELTSGFVHGVDRRGPTAEYGLAGPLVQGKALLLPAESNAAPGVAVALGLLPPLGLGPLEPEGTSGFAFAIVTENLWDEALLLHANLGFALGHVPGHGLSDPVVPLLTAGFGFQAQVIGGMHLVAEIYHGDPYEPRSAFGAVQAGYRYIFNDDVQVDGTFGTSLIPVGVGTDQAYERWVTLGLRLVSPPLW